MRARWIPAIAGMTVKRGNDGEGAGMTVKALE